MAVFDLNQWHVRLHRITGTMALHWCRATASELQQWSAELRAIAGEMAAKANAASFQPDQASPPDTDAPHAGHGSR
jgi:hypothetical protein